MDGGVQLTALSILVGLFVWYLKTQTKRDGKREKDALLERNKIQEKRDKEQKEERDYYRKVIDGGMRKNVELNVKGIALQKEMINDFKKHNGHSEKFSEKVVETLGGVKDAVGLICDKLNGGSKRMTKAKKKLSEKT